MDFKAELALRAALDRMDVEDLCGQVLMIDLVGTRLGDGMRSLMETVRPGGVLLFDYNIDSPLGLFRLTGELKAWCSNRQMPAPVFAIDQEGGPISRLTSKRGFLPYPSPMAMAACGDEALFTALVASMAREIRGAGIDLDLAPVLDVIGPKSSSVLGIRAFGDRPRAVARWGELWVRAMASGGVASAAKHFPGHGGASQDSHLDLPDVRDERATLITRDLVPFLAAMRSGCEAFLSAHVFYRELEPESGRPATLSAHILHGLLRQQMFFDGLLITDSMVMGAIARHREPAEAVSEALAAGADFALVPDSPQRLMELHAGLVEMARKDVDFRAIVARAAERILAWKFRQARRRPPSAPLSSRDWEEGRRLSETVSRRSIAALGNRGFDLRGDRGLVVEIPQARGLIEAVGCQGAVITTEPSPADLDGLLRRAREAPWLCVVYQQDERSPWAADLARSLLAAQGEAVLVLTGLPWEKGDLAVSRTLYTFGWTPWTASQLAKILRGEETAQGVMPVDAEARDRAP